MKVRGYGGGRSFEAKLLSRYGYRLLVMNRMVVEASERRLRTEKRRSFFQFFLDLLSGVFGFFRADKRRFTDLPGGPNKRERLEMPRPSRQSFAKSKANPAAIGVRRKVI